MQSDEASVDEADEEDSILGSPTSQHTDNNLKLGHTYMHTYIHTYIVLFDCYKINIISTLTNIYIHAQDYRFLYLGRAAWQAGLREDSSRLTWPRQP